MEQIRTASFPKVTNVLLAFANTEYSLTLNPSVRRFLIRARESTSIKLSYQVGQSGIHYLEIRSSEVYDEDEVYGDIVLYMQSPSANTTVEVLEWIQK